MQAPTLPPDEAARLRAVRALGLLDTPAEARFDRLTRLARRLFDLPVALVTLVDQDRQWFKSRQGLDVGETPRSVSFCGHAILSDDLLIIEDARSDPRFADNPLVTGPPHIVFYAGAPLRVLSGQRIGTLCVIDRRARQFDAEQRQALRDLADSVEDEINRARLGEHNLSLTKLAQISTLQEDGALPRMRRALGEACDFLGLESGIVSRIRPPMYEVIVQHAPVEQQAEGRQCALEQTYCELTWQGKSVVALEDVAGSAYSGHPCFVQTGLRSYIAAPLAVDGQRFGTLSFTALGARHKPFGAAEREFVRLLATWMERELARWLAATAKSRVEAELATTVELLERTHAVARIGRWSVDLRGAQPELEWSPVVCDIHEVASDFRCSLNEAFHFYPEGPSRSRVKQVYRQAVEQGRAFDEELQLCTARGQRRWVRAIGLPVQREGRCERVHGLLLDLTERKRSELAQAEALRLSQRQLSLLLDPLLQSSELDQVWPYLTEQVAAALTAERVSVWLFSDQADAIECIDLFERTAFTHSRGERLACRDYPNYFRSLASASLVVADDAHTHPSTREFSSRYLQPLNIGAMLDGVISSDRGMLGVICVEHVGGPRQWSIAEQNFVFAMSVLAAGLFSNDERRRALASLRASEERFRNLIEDVPGAAYRCALDAERTMLYLSEGIEPLCGYHASEFVEGGQRSYVSLIHPQDRDAHAREIRSAVQGARAWEIEYRLQHRDGALRWVADRGHAIFDSQGEVQSLSGFIHDIGARKLAEKELLDHAAFLHTVISTMVDGLLTVDPGGRILSANPAVAQMFGVEQEQLPGRGIDQLLPTHARLDALVGRRVELEAVRGNGERFPVEVTVSDVDHQGDRIFVGMLRDISERRRVERMKNEFVSTVSHELRTPLTSIGGALSLLAGGALGQLSERAQQLVQVAMQNGQRLTLLVNDLLDMDKLLAGQMVFDLQSLTLRSVVQEALDANSDFAARFDVRLRQEIDDHSATQTLRADALRLQQVLSNLLSNAAKFSPAGSEVILRARVFDGSVKLEVQDRGPGVPAAFIERLFSKFSQADSSDTRHKGGTGLGLAISRELIERMGGRIGYRAADGGGAVFWCELPVG